jgi:hypothetical protein
MRFVLMLILRQLTPIALFFAAAAALGLGLLRFR